MRLIARTAALAALSLLLGAAGPADSPVNVPEPDGLYTGPPRGYTPATLKGATVIDLKGLEGLLPEKPVLIDVVLADRRPAGLPDDRPWLPTHRSIPGAVWLPGAGGAPLPPDQEDAFLRRVAELTGGDPSKSVVTFCRPECWGSWNAGKRLIAAGYTRVHWFPLGVEGWQDDHDTAVAKPDPAWVAATAGREAQR
ncbi:rhodanese-like domain-containing protein [Methylobacterium sp. B4]|uniref:rhodanese-like domain-containing protein n=1 Tax=Methylobacterium sp. B4 TaxID=1938755 RepID=UPI000D76E4F9|nr:rhodanese-like domain-containing protein [Methylobacterium sp. B4]PXW65703.1 PQQ-dependent catabolism-associated CXXCW motif protein [Methylobacterium sp. B4]